MNSCMINYLRKIVKRLIAKPNEVYIAVDTNVPFHIEQVGKMYPVIHTVVGNKSVGQIKLFLLENNKLRVGQALILNSDREVWIHIGNDYFKNIMKL